MPITDSPLRYPGGKTQLAPFVRELAQINDLDRGLYAEPFAGGAGIAWRLLLHGDMSEVWINDIDPALFAFWNTVVNNPDPLCERIRRIKVTIRQWHKQRAALYDSSSSLLDIAYATLFLNRTNRSGILKGGVIGGKGQNGDYHLDCRFNKDDLIRKIQRIHIYREVIKVTQMDAKECLRKWEKSLPSRSLINIDPPYYQKGRDLYLSFYTEKDHKQLSTRVRGLTVPWMITYDDTPPIEALYRGLPLYRNNLIYSAQVKRRSHELMVLAPHLKRPGKLLKKAAA